MQCKPTICGIVALGPNNVIGRDGVMPWHCSDDLRVFKYLTMGSPCIFGKTTYDNLPLKPLPGRLNIVCSRSYNTEQIDGALHVPSLEEAIYQCGNVQRVFICGGAVLYKYALDNDLIDTMYVSRIFGWNLKQAINQNPGAYTYFNYQFDVSKWIGGRIDFPPHVFQYPNKTLGTYATFYRYDRFR